MPDTAAQILCTQCGLCCNGAIFADVELRNKQEATSMECLGLEIDDEDGRELLIQPCRALKGTRCNIYAHRPECCRSFECKVLKDFGSGEIGFAESTQVVRDLREILASHDHESAQAFISMRFL